MRQIDTGTSLVRYARAAGVGYLVIIVTGIFAEFAVRTTLRVPGDAAQTAANILAAPLLYRSSIAADLLMLVADVAVALALYVVFRGVSRNLAMLAAFFRLTHAAVVAVNLLNVYVPLVLLREGGVRTALGDAQVEALALVHLEAHAYGYAIGLVFFGVYCAILGTLILKSTLVPRVLGLLLLVASAGYLIDSFARTLLADYAAYEVILGMVVLVPAFVAELSFSLWLVVKGVRPAEVAS